MVECSVVKHSQIVRIAKEKFPLTIAEKLILPCCKDIVRRLIEDVGGKKLSCVPLSKEICANSG